LARQTAFYSRQLALTSRQHARYVSSVAAAVGEQRGPPIVPHAALSKAALPFPVAAEIMPTDRPLSSSVRMASHANASSDMQARQVNSTASTTRSVLNNCTQPQQGHTVLQQEVSYQTKVKTQCPRYPVRAVVKFDWTLYASRLLTLATRSLRSRCFTRQSR
jgi:hypothetical protein